MSQRVFISLILCHLNNGIMINIKIEFVIKPNESLEFVGKIVKEFINNIRKNEPATIEYTSFQYKDNERHFVHFMTFTDEDAQLKHRNTAYCQDFVSKLYPLCEKEPEVYGLEKVAKK